MKNKQARGYTGTLHLRWDAANVSRQGENTGLQPQDFWGELEI